MNEIAASLLATLLRMSLFLGAAALAVLILLKFARPSSSRVHRAAWFWCFCRVGSGGVCR